MNYSPTTEVSGILRRIGAGDRNGARDLLPIVYHELRRLAQTYVRGERANHSLQATALVHEAFLRLCQNEIAAWRQDRAHFFAVAATTMRRVLVERARTHSAAKRRGAAVQDCITLSDRIESPERDINLVRLDEALDRLARFDRQQSGIVELRFFAEMTIEETAHVLQIFNATVKRKWTFAKARLYREIGGDKD